MQYVLIQVKVPRDFKERFLALAKAEGYSLSEAVREALREFMDKLERKQFERRQLAQVI